MENLLKKEDLELDVIDNNLDKDWEKYFVPNGIMSKDDIEELLITRGVSSTDCLEWCLALEDADGEWYEGNVNEMPEGFEELNGFFDFPEAFKLFKTFKLFDGEHLYLKFMPESLDDPDYEDMIVFDRDDTLRTVEDLDLDVVDQDEEDLMLIAFSEYLEDDLGKEASLERAYPEDTHGYNSHVYTNTLDGSEWLILTYDEAEEYARDDLESLIDDVGPIEAFGWDYVENYIDEDAVDEMMENDVRNWVDSMGEDELIEEMENYGVIDEDDMIPDPDWEADPDEPDEEPDMIYPDNLVWDKTDELVDAIIGSYRSGIDYFEEHYGNLKELIEDNPDLVDTEGIISDILSYDGFGDRLASYDGREEEFTFEDEYGNTKYMYAYRIN